jgi:tetratricopeptide (TPR) repeat protein
MQAGIRRVLIPALLALSPLPAQQPGEDYFDARNVPLVRGLLEKGDYETCLRACGIAIERGQPSAEWPVMRLTALAELGRTDEALAAAEEALATHGEDLRLLMARQRLALSLGKKDLAAETLRRVNEIARKLSAKDRSGADLVALGQAAIAAGADAKKVIAQFFDPAKKKTEVAAEAGLASGELAIAKGDFARAATEFRAALKLQPESSALRFGLAQAFENSDREKCVKLLEQVLEVNPRHTGALVMLAELNIGAEDFVEAADLLRRALEVNPRKPEAHALKAVVSMLWKNDARAADAALEEARKAWPQNPAVDHLVGRCLSHAYRFAEGAGHQRGALEMATDHLPAKLQLCRDLLRLGHEEEAMKLAKEVRDADGYNIQAHNLGLLEKEMQGFVTLEQDGFILRLPKLDEEIYADRALALLVEARAKLGARYGLSFDKPVLVEFFPSQQDFAIRTFGNLGGQGILGACFGTVVTMNRPGGIEARRSNWESTLWHEFCHVVTLTVTRNRMPRWLSEGISVYEEALRDPACGMRMNADYRRLILEEDALTPVSELSSAFTNAKSGEHLMFAYFEAAQVVEFLVKKFGAEKFRAVLADLGDGVRINDALAKNLAPLKKIEKEFAAQMKQAAEALAPRADWSEPQDLDAGDPAAVAAFLEKHPNNLTALHQRARQLLEEQDWEGALKIARELIGVFPSDVESGCGHEVAALAYRGLKKKPEEAAEFRAWAQASGDAVSAFQRLMVLDAAANDWAALEQSARWMLAVNPLLKQPHEALASALENLRRPDEAACSLRKLQVLGPDNPADTNFRLARLLKDKDRDKSRRYVLDALVDAPRHREALLLLEQVRANPEPQP